MRIKRRLTYNNLLHFCLLLFVTLTPLHAVEITENVNLRGFASLQSLINTSEDTRRKLPSGSADILEKDTPYFKTSLAGLQLDAGLNDSFEVMVQGIYIKERDGDEYEPRLEWAMLGYHFGDDYTLRLGDMKISSMDGAQNRYIGYSYLWVFPQTSFNGINGFENFYGLELAKRGYVGNLDYEWQLSGGKLQNHVDQEDEGKYLYNGAVKLYYGDWMLRLGAGKLVFDHYSPNGNLIGKNKNITFASVEAQWQHDGFELSGGYNTHMTDSIPESNSQYLSLAYRFDWLTPYALYTRSEVTGIPLANIPPAPSTGGGPGGPPPERDPVFGDDLQEHYILGFRYDIFEGIAFKAEYDRMEKNPPVGESDSYNFVNLTLDMVF